jgi:SAM-dependent methyltransferase
VLTLDENRPPVPPADLILRVVVPFEASDVESARHAFDIEGLNNLRLLERVVAAVPFAHFADGVWLGDDRIAAARSLSAFSRMLDFGCGCGRFLRHLGPLADKLDIHGADIDGEMIGWLRSNVPFGRYEVAPAEPPLPYPDHHFDLVISYSVFTHLDERMQDLWLRELQRITRPGALLLLTVQGASTWQRTRADAERAGDSFERWQAELETRGILFIADDSFVGSTHPDFYHSTIHATWYVFEHWGEQFDVEAYLPDGAWAQDLVVLRRRPDGPPPASLAIGRRAQVERVATGKRRRWLPRQRRSDRDGQALMRELAMLRTGLYEQGRRISVIAAQLRDEIDAARRDRSGD